MAGGILREQLSSELEKKGLQEKQASELVSLLSALEELRYSSENVDVSELSSQVESQLKELKRFKGSSKA